MEMINLENEIRQRFVNDLVSNFKKYGGELVNLDISMRPTDFSGYELVAKGYFKNEGIQQLHTNGVQDEEPKLKFIHYDDYASAEVVAHTKPYGDFPGEDIHDIIAYCAKVSNKKNQSDLSKSKKLIDYLVKHAHYSPFEMANIVMEVKTTRDIARQMLRHRSYSFQEFSLRYEEADNIFILSDARMQDEKNRQNSIDTDDEKLKSWWEDAQKDACEASYDKYSEALGLGIAKEQARKVLPEGNTPSKLYMNGTIRSWLHYIDLRSGNGTQKEHILIAEKCLEAIDKIFNLSSYLKKEEVFDEFAFDKRPIDCRERLIEEGKLSQFSVCQSKGCEPAHKVCKRKNYRDQVEESVKHIVKNSMSRRPSVNPGRKWNI